MSNIGLAAVTLIGQKHRQRGIPCEDASVAKSKNGVDVVVVADGAGSKQYTHARFGSAGACEAISDLLIEHFDALYNENREAAVRSLIIASIHIKFADIIAEQKLDSIERLSCTLLFAAVKDRRLLVGHIGDGLIVRVSSSGLSPLTMPQNGSNASSTYFVTAPHAADYLRLIKTTTDDLHGLALMTDGVQDSVYDENSGIVKPVVARMVETLSLGREKSEADIKNILEKYIVGASNNSDDASFGVMLFGNTKAPDSKSLPTGADAFPREQETFKDVQMMLAPDVKRARAIIINTKTTSPVNPSDDNGHIRKADSEPETAAPDTAEPIKNLNESAKKAVRILIPVTIVEFLIIFALLIKMFLF